jgi:lipoyl(octanoyl) transferase
MIDTLAAFNVAGERRDGRIGVWVRRRTRAPAARTRSRRSACGSRWVSFHGIALNVAPDLSHFGGIVPCGISDQGVTSLEDLGQIVSMPEVDIALRAAFETALRADRRHAARGTCLGGMSGPFCDSPPSLGGRHDLATI